MKKGSEANMFSKDEIFYTITDKVAIITLNRPEQRNAFTDSMIIRWAEILRDLKNDPEVNVIVLTGAGDRAFCSGGDLHALTNSLELDALDRKHELWEHIHQVAFEMDRIDKPTIAAINGVAVGAGLDMALLCDLRFMAETASVSEGYVKIGLVPGDGGAYLLPRVIGTSKALEMLWTGDFYSAKECLDMGLVNRVYPQELLMEGTLNFAKKVANGPTAAIRMIKRAVYQSEKLDLRTALDLISSHFAIIRETADHKEGISAMLEKRRPNFTGQ